MPPCGQLTLPLLLLLGLRALAVCPPTCVCSHSHRVVDCSGRGLGWLPDGLQHNIRALNLSRNRLQDLDGLLGHFAHLRTLDVSHNLLERLPTDLPRALWEIWASGNRVRQLEKNDTAYHWNLRALDLSSNELERVVFINNTLPDLLLLNLSHNKFWTVPTNMPANLETVDLSHNYLVQILPGSLDRLPRLARFYLHGNRFEWVGEGAFSRLDRLRLVTLDDNPWACDDEENITALLAWMHQTAARVLGCPCHTRRVCGATHPATTGGGAWRFASYTHPPLPVSPVAWDDDDDDDYDDNDGNDGRRRPPAAGSVTSGYLSKPAPFGLLPDDSIFFPSGNSSTANFSSHPTGHLLFSTVATTTTTTPRPRKAKTASVRSTNMGLRASGTVALNVLLTTTVFNVF